MVLSRKQRSILVVVFALSLVIMFAKTALAARYSSSSYVIDASVQNNFGGQGTSSNYSMTSSGGESIVGNGASGSYKMGMGYTAQLIRAIQVSVAQASVSFPTVLAGTPQAVSLGVDTQTDASGYSLSISQNGNLNNGAGQTISGVSGTIASPVTWVNGTTKGLGFTISAASGGIPAPWNSGNAYAQFPSTATTFLTHTGYISGIDTTTLGLKLDVSSTQISGVYTNTVTVTGTITP